MSKLAVVSAAIRVERSHIHPLVPSSSRARTSPGSRPENDTSPAPPWAVKYCSASDSPATTRLPTSMAFFKKLAPADGAAPGSAASPPSPPPAPDSVLGLVSRVSKATFVVFHRNLPGSAYTLWPGSSWHVRSWLAVPTVRCLTVMASSVLGRHLKGARAERTAHAHGSHRVRWGIGDMPAQTRDLAHADRLRAYGPGLRRPPRRVCPPPGMGPRRPARGVAMVDESLRRAVHDHIVGTPEYTAEEIESASGVPLEEAERLWTELGFPRIAPTERFFTAADVAVLTTLRQLQSTGLATPEVAIAMTRVLGQTMARVAMAQAQNIALVIDDEEAASLEPHEITAALDGILPMFDTFISYVWRRHLAAALGRRFDDRPTEVVGFADIVGYTRRTADMEPGSLHELVARFQEIANQRVTTAGGRVLKVIGDAVMFVVPDAPRAARAAIGISEAAHDDDALPEVRIGLATGPVVEIEGDFYGETVNRASRLVELALPGTVVVDDDTGTALFDDDLRVRPMRPRKLKGLGMVPMWVVRPPRTPSAERAEEGRQHT